MKPRDRTGTPTSTTSAALAGVVATSLRAPRCARSGIAAILATFTAEAGADLAAAYLVGGDHVELVAAGGPAAGLAGPAGPAPPGLARPLAARSDGQADADAALPEPWRSFSSVVTEACALTDDRHLVLVVAVDGEHPLRVAPRTVLGPLASLAAVASLTHQAELARTRLARREQEQAMVSAALQHDLRSPLHAVVSAASTLRDRFDDLGPEGRARLLDLLVEQSQRAADLASEALSSMSAHAPVRSMRTDLRALLDSVVEAVTTRCGGDVVVSVPDTPVVTDPVRLERALHNLVDNAVKYGPTGEPVCVAAAVDDRHLVVTVADRGDGVAEAVLPSLFGAFVTDPEVAGGTGMGLHSTRLLAEELGGRVTYSRRDGWTRFSLTVPVELAEDGGAGTPVAVEEPV